MISHFERCAILPHGESALTVGDFGQRSPAHSPYGNADLFDGGAEG